MIKHAGFMAIVFMTAALCLGQKHDSSDYIYDDTKIQKYDLSFFIEKWSDTLEAHKANDQEYIPARLTWHGENGDSMTLDSIGVRYKGNSSYNFAGTNPKKPYKFKFDKYRKNQKFFNLSIINLGNLVRDPSCMREKISYDLSRKLMPTSRASYAKIFVSGAEIGLFLQVEEVDDNFLHLNFKDDQSNLYKSSDNGTAMKFLGVNQTDYAKDYDLKTNTTANDWSGLILMLDKLNNTSDTNFVKVVGKALDLDNCIRYLAFNMVTSNFDSYTGSSRNLYLYDDQQSKKFKLIPWDFNLGWGNYPGGWNIITVDAFAIPNLNIRPLSKRILDNDSLKYVYGKYISDMINYYICPDTIASMAARLKGILDSAVKNAANNFYDYDKFLSNIETDYTYSEGSTRITIPGIKSFAKARFPELKKQLETQKIAVLNPSFRSSATNAAFQCQSAFGGKHINVSYSLKTAVHEISLSIHNAKGELMRSLISGNKTAGSYTDIVDVRTLPAGYYTVSLNTGTMKASVGMILTKGN
jgi:hypothetical protein